ncbi:hypothetical protein [Natrinema versiforme]|uniref:Uncharacterized protein n=1 Tax=Natrinema versiforme JCM 10478 TaxID=1227496 RepID=L9Y476_9EURY|nr:hypothetical protein [Natrinema versiforme]ELY68889.1 hypothetical protein C489_05968 [Natrinema versiforme JCM 10478]
MTDAGDTLAAIAADANVLGFKPHVDALVLQPGGTTFVYYTRDDEIRCVYRTAHGPDAWTGGNAKEADRVREHVRAVGIEHVETTDQRPFNRLSSGPFRDTSQFSDARLWALADTFGDFESIATARSDLLETAPGIGETLARKAARELAQYPLTDADEQEVSDSE